MNRLEEIIQKLPIGVERTVARQISFHVGFINRVDLQELLADIAAKSDVGIIRELTLMSVIQSFRYQGARICTAEESIQGKRMIMIYLAANVGEYSEFRKKYLVPANAIVLAVSAMDYEMEVVGKEDQTPQIPEIPEAPEQLTRQPQQISFPIE